MAQAKQYMRRGELVPDTTVLEMVRERSLCLRCRGGFLLDGFPRTAAQARAAGDWVRVAVYLQVPTDVLIDRMRSRAQSDGRDDDTESVMRHRIEEFERLTPALLDYYEGRATVLRIDGTPPIEDVTAAIVAGLDRMAPGMD